MKLLRLVNAIGGRKFCHDAKDLVLAEKYLEDKVCRLILNNPKKRNALSLSMLDALKENLVRCSKDDKLRTIILAAQPPVFSAGHDLKELTKEAATEHAIIFQRCTEVTSLIQDIQLPVIAEVKGLAAAAGCQLVASCDIVIAAEDSHFSTPGAKAGLFCSTPGIAVARAVPLKVAMYMLLTGDTIDAQEALRAGLVSRLVPADHVQAEALSTAKKICDLSKSVIALGKKFFYSQIGLSRQAAFMQGEKVMVDNLKLKDGQEGIESFIKKRKPEWKHTEEKF